MKANWLNALAVAVLITLTMVGIMPNYEFRCDECGSSREVYASLNEEILNPICCTRAMSRVWGSIPAIFKTGGFYKTDNK